MFGKTRKKLERQRMLEVRSRAKPMQVVRLKMAGSALAISAGVVLVLFVCWKGGEFALDRFVYSNPTLSISEIEIETDGIIPIEQIRAWSNVKNGENILALDMARIKRDLEMVPLIDSASVERVLPRSLIITVREREPIARVVVFAPRERDGLLEPSTIYLDEYGMVIPPVLRTLNSSAFDAATRFLPAITGAGSTSFRPGHLVTSAPILAALKWLRTFQSSEMAGQVDIRAIDVASQSALLITTEQGNEISFAYQDFETQLARWRLIQGWGMQRTQTLASLDLAVTNYIPAVWTSSTNAPPSAVREPQASPYRKKHV
jgi:cell division septal protein FtsQ